MKSSLQLRCCTAVMLLCLSLFSTPYLQAASLPNAKPAQVGFSAERLDRLSRAMQAYVDQGRVAGLVTRSLCATAKWSEKRLSKIDIRTQPAHRSTPSAHRLADQGDHQHNHQRQLGGGQTAVG